MDKFFKKPDPLSEIRKAFDEGWNSVGQRPQERRAAEPERPRATRIPPQYANPFKKMIDSMERSKRVDVERETREPAYPDFGGM